MKDSAKLRRQLYLIRFLDQPYTYPSPEKLCHHLRDHDIDYASAASVERDIRDIRADYDISITYHRRERGYFLDLPADEDISNFRDFVRLLERRERLEVLTQSGRSEAQYLQLEQNEGFRGLDLMAPLWNALQRKLVVSFIIGLIKISPPNSAGSSRGCCSSIGIGGIWTVSTWTVIANAGSDSTE